MIARLALLILLWPGLAAATELDLPANAVRVLDQVTEPGSYDMPVGAFTEGEVPARHLEGRVSRRAWQIAGSGISNLQLLARVRQDLARQGFVPVFECDNENCGGFDFRFGTEVLPPPEMFVDLGAFRFLSAEREGDSQISVLISRSGQVSFIQVIEVGASAPEVEQGVPEIASANPAPGIAADLDAKGHAIMADLKFASGSVTLADQDFESLRQLADYLSAHPGYRVALVGHTDSSGSLEANIAISRQRAESVRARLLSDFGVSGDRVAAEGMGYLAPIASNLNPEGREANRRVEVVILSGGEG